MFGEIAAAVAEATEAGEAAEVAESAGAIDVADADSILENANESLGADEMAESAFPEEIQNMDSLLDQANESLGSETETLDKQGGRFGDIFKEGEGETTEVHHMPADSTTELSRNDGPAIKMDKADHRETASCGNSKEAQEYRAQQKALIEQGDFRGALQMDIDDIHDKFGSKYDEAISEMLDYVDQLEMEGKI